MSMLAVYQSFDTRSTSFSMIHFWKIQLANRKKPFGQQFYRRMWWAAKLAPIELNSGIICKFHVNYFRNSMKRSIVWDSQTVCELGIGAKCAHVISSPLRPLYWTQNDVNFCTHQFLCHIYGTRPNSQLTKTDFAFSPFQHEGNREYRSIDLSICIDKASSWHPATFRRMHWKVATTQLWNGVMSATEASYWQRNRRENPAQWKKWSTAAGTNGRAQLIRNYVCNC